MERQTAGGAEERLVHIPTGEEPGAMATVGRLACDWFRRYLTPNAGDPAQEGE
jgi:hypothetical protein